MGRGAKHSHRERRRIDLVAIDIDGTLLRTDKRLSVNVVNTIAQAKARGVRVVLATARPPRSTRGIHRLLGLDTAAITYNGALIHDEARNQTLLHCPVPAKMVQRIIRYARRVDKQVVASVEILDRWYTDHAGDAIPGETGARFAPHCVAPLESFWHKPATKVMLHAPPQVLGRVKVLLEAKFSGQAVVRVCDSHLIQVVHPEVDKSRALKHVAEHYGIDRRHVMAIGDAPNDEGMIRWAGLGVAVGNAWPAVQAAARAVVAHNDQDGVAEAIERFVLRGG